MPLPTNKSLRFLGAHILLAIIYPSLWIITVVVIASIIALAQQGHWIFSLPPDHITHWHFFAGSMIYFALASVTYTIDGVARSEARRRQAEIWMLRARLNPHFLFNTLHSLLALVRYDPDAADSALEQFAGMFRYALRVNQNSLEEVTLLEEWNFTRDYLALERLRLGERLRLETNISEQALTCLIPAFLLQPLVENAIRYAVAPRAEGGTIWVYASCEAHYLTVTVKDDGPGTTSPEALTSSGVGLQVAREQLAAYYGGSAKIEIAKDLSKGFAVTASIPIRE
jgi:sensor histidine kinase YesM